MTSVLATGAATDCTASAFAQELGIVGEAFEALKAPDIQIEDGVPKAIKKNWQKWCLRGHPDKGGDTDAFIAMETRYCAFKDWFQAQRDAPANRAKDRSQQKAQAKQDGDKELEGARKALEDKQYEDAKVFAEEAIKAYEAYKNLQLRKDDAQKMVLEATKLKEAAEEQIRLRELEKRLRDADKARIIALEREIEMLKNENVNLQTEAKCQFLLNSQDWQQKLNDSEERSSASMRELQDKCKNLENSNENLKREMEEALEEAWEEAGLGKKASATHGLLFSFFGSMALRPQSSGGSKKCERSVKDSVKSAIKDELARVKAELTASQNKVDELKEVMQQQQNVCDARKTAQTDMQAKITAKDAELNLPHANAQRLEATPNEDAHAEEMRTKRTAIVEDKERAKKESFEAHQARWAENNNVVTAVGLPRASAYTDPRVCNIEQESELREIRDKLSAQEKLFEACELKLQEALQLVASRNTATI